MSDRMTLHNNHAREKPKGWVIRGMSSVMLAGGWQHIVLYRFATDYLVVSSAFICSAFLV